MKANLVLLLMICQISAPIRESNVNSNCCYSKLGEIFSNPYFLFREYKKTITEYTLEKLTADLLPEEREDEFGFLYDLNLILENQKLEEK